MGRLLTESIGRIATLLGFDGTNFSALRVDTSGRLKVRGEDQLFSYQGSVANQSRGVPSGAGGYRESASPPAGTIWVITNLSAGDITTATTEHFYGLQRGVVGHAVYVTRAAFAANQRTNYATRLYLVPGDTIRVTFTGSLVTDDCALDIIGYSMTIAV